MKKNSCKKHHIKFLPQAFDGFVPDNRFLDGGKRLEGWKETMDVFLPSDQLGKGAQLLCQCQQYLVLQTMGIYEPYVQEVLSNIHCIITT